MNQLLACLLTLLFSLSGPAMGGYSDFERSSNAARGGGNVGGKITGYTKHGLMQAIGRDGGRGVHPKAIPDAVRSPKKVIEQAGGNTKYIGDDATVILNGERKVIKQAVRAFKDPPYTIIRTDVPTSSLPKPVSVDSEIPAYVVPNASLPGLTPTVLDTMPIPGSR